MSPDLSESRSGEVNVPLGRCLCLFLKRVQYMNSAADGGQLDDAIGARRLTNPDLANTRSDRCHRLPVGRLFADLNLKQLISSLASGVGRKCFNIGSAAAVPPHLLHDRVMPELA
jgi:hypothetical protein